MPCNAKLLGIQCEAHIGSYIGSMFDTHNGKTTTSDGGELIVTWTYLPKVG